MAVTLPDDYCVHCHSDIARDRPSHEGLAFSTCNSAGCHNFHDNRALYSDFLLKHANEPVQLAVQRVALIDFLNNADGEPIKVPEALTAADADAPAQHRGEPDVVTTWAADAHAKGGVNCAGCHTRKTEPDKWIAAPGLDTCQSCHANEARTFTEGRHGMRLRDGMWATRDGLFGLFKASKLTPMTPANARLPMKPEAAHKELTCNTCHSDGYDLVRAQVAACAGCHDDTHTKAYFASLHYDLFRKEAWRGRIKQKGLSFSGRRRFWQLFTVHAALNPNQAPTERDYDAFVTEVRGMAAAVDNGAVTLVGAGPGDPELLTLKAVRALQSADIILYDDLVSGDVLDFARREARKLLVGKNRPRAGVQTG
jgi:hypothetical protein